MKICFICPEYPPFPHGGMGTFVQVMGRALVNAGHEVRVAGLYRDTTHYPEYQEDAGVRVWRLRQPRVPYGWVLGRLRLFRLVAGWIRSGQIDVVDAHDPEGWFARWPRLAAPLMIRAGGSFSYFAFELGQPIDRTQFWFERTSYRRADAWVAKSKYIGEVTQRLFGLENGPEAILYNPVNLPSRVPPFESRKPGKIVFTGTLTPKKGIIPLIDAWAVVHRDFPWAELHLYGKDGRAADGQSMQSFLQKRLPDTAAPSVHFHGHVHREALYEALASARAAVFPSYSEGFAWAPLEAMANACPTIYSCLGSGSELIVDRRDGILIDPNQPAQIADAILGLLRDDAAAYRFSEAGRTRILDAFTLDKLVPVNEAFYSNLICRFHRSRAWRTVEPISRAQSSASTR